MKAVVPNELARYTAATKKGKDPEKVATVLDLMRASKRILRGYNRDPLARRTKVRLKAEFAFLISWEKALQTWKKTSDETERARLMAEWNSSLNADPEVPTQIDAIWSEWHPAFLTNSFVKLLKVTDDPQIIGSITHVLGYYGQDAEETLLKEKLASLTGQSDADKMNVANIGIALRKIGYWRSGDPFRMGPNPTGGK